MRRRRAILMAQDAMQSSMVSLARPRQGAVRRSQTWGFGREEWLADLELTARRTLSVRDLEIHRLYHLAGLPWTDCTRALGMSKGNFYHAAYRIQAELGKAWAEERPYGLWPTKEY